MSSGASAVLALACVVASCTSVQRSAHEPPEPKPAPQVSPPPLHSVPRPVTTAAGDGGSEDAADRTALTRRLELRDPGREPRRILRYVLSKGTRQKLRVRITTRLAAGGAPGSESRLDAPLEISVLEVDAGGAGHFHYDLGPLKLSGSTAGASSLGFGGASGIRLGGGAIIAADGELTDHRMDPPAREDGPEAEIVRSLLASVIELPVEPVGAGARWELVLEARSSEVAITRTTSYLLAAFTAAGAQIRVSEEERVLVPGAAGPSQLASAPSSGQWLARLGQVLPEGHQTMKAAILHQDGGELFTELRLARH